MSNAINGWRVSIASGLNETVRTVEYPDGECGYYGLGCAISDALHSETDGIDFLGVEILADAVSRFGDRDYEAGEVLHELFVAFVRAAEELTEAIETWRKGDR